MNRKAISHTVPGRRGRAALAVLTALAVLLGAGMPAAAAEQTPDPVDLSRNVSLTITPGPANMLDDLAEADLVLDVYRVASAAGEEGADTYTFQTEGAFSSLTVAPDITSEGWRELAQQAAAIVRANPAITAVSVEVDGSSGRAADTTPLTGGSGLYLVIAHGRDIADYWDDLSNGTIATLADTTSYLYHFSPELIALPGRYSDILDDGTPNLNMIGNDMGNLIDWKYDVTASLKPDREPRTGSIRIIKSLQVYEDSEPVTFVFDVEATLNGVNVYSDVHTMTFNAAEDQSLLIENLPIGAEVTVTEVYTGSKYRLVSDGEQTATVTLEDVAEVTFVNTYDNTNYGGGSIVNQFSYSETDEQNWTWTQIYDR